MPTSMDSLAKDPLFLVLQDVVEPQEPSATQDLTELYGLTALARSVARTDPVTGEKRKLRKSYKNQISDLSGKHAIPGPSAPSEWSILSLARQPRFIQSDPPRDPPTLAAFDQKRLAAALDFDHTPASGIPGFDAALLAIPTASAAAAGAVPVASKPGSNATSPAYSGSPYYQVHGRRNGSLSNAAMTAESSNDDSPVSVRHVKRLKRKDTSEEAPSKRRKKSIYS